MAEETFQASKPPLGTSGISTGAQPLLLARMQVSLQGNIIFSTLMYHFLLKKKMASQFCTYCKTFAQLYHCPRGFLLRKNPSDDMRLTYRHKQGREPNQPL